MDINTNPLHVLNNLENFTLKDLSEELLQNRLFITEYFQRRTSVEYEYIPSDLLANPVFVYMTVNKNPDIYLLYGKKDSAIFNKIKSLHPETCLKYASDEEQNDIEFCKSIFSLSVLNYCYASETVRKNILISNLIFSQNLHNKENLRHLPKEQAKDRDFIFNLIKNNPSIFQYVNKKFRGDREIVEYAVKKESKLFKYVNEEIKFDTVLINSILNNFSQLSSYHKNEYCKDILINLPENYFNQHFCEKHKDLITKNFVNLKPVIRNIPLVIATALLQVEMINNSKSWYQRPIINKIPDEKTRYALSNLLLNSSGIRKQEIDNYLLKSQLENSLDRKNTTPKIKI